jgi:hypothetical protein
MTRPDTPAANSSRRPLLQRGISSSSSSAVGQSPPRIGITILTNPARTRTLSVPPIHEEKIRSSTFCRSPLPYPAPPHAYTILSNSARTLSLPSVQIAHSSSSSTQQSNFPPPQPRITILTNPAREKQRTTQPRSTQSTRSVPATTPISILKAPAPAPRIPAQAQAQAPASAAGIKLSKPAADAVKLEGKAQNEEAKLLLPRIVVHEPVSWAKTGVHHLGTGTDPGTTKNHGEMLGIPVVTGRSRLHENDLARYYPKEHAAEQLMRRRRLMARSGNRAGAARRREQARPSRQTATSTSTPSVALMVSRINARTRAHASTPIPTGKPPVAPKSATRMH